MVKLKKLIFDYKYLIMFLIGMGIMLCRCSYSLKYPSLYAEDGVWLGYLLKNGFFWTITNARLDYYPIVIIFMLELAHVLSEIFCNGDIGTIPIFITFISCAYFTIVAMLPSMTFGNRINWIGKIFIFLAILCLPLGTSYTEILGRTLQCHFFIWIIVFCLLIYRYDNKNLKNKKIIISTIDILLIPLILTFPSVLLLYGIYGIIEIYTIIKEHFYTKKLRKKEKRFTVKKFQKALKIELKKYHIWSLLISFITIFILSIIVLIRMKNANMDFGSGFNYNSMIEILIRTFAYPLVFGFYKSLSDIKSIIILLLLAVVLIYSYFKIRKQTRGIYLLSILSFLTIGIITLATRGSITFFLNTYSNSYPDRYFMLSNACLFFPFGIIISEGTQFKNRKSILTWSSIFIIVYCLINLIIYSTMIFTFDKNEVPWIKDISLSNRLQESFNLDQRSEDGNSYIINIDPEWTFEVPLRNMDNSVKK